jgi:hypothetical protein
LLKLLIHPDLLPFHPLLVLTYVLLLMMSANPFAFGGEQRSVLLLLSVFSTSFLIPALGVVLMKPLGLIKELQMRDKQERIGPYIVCGVFYLWLYKNFMGGTVPELYAKFTLGACIALFLAFFVNIFSKISMYATGMGSLIAMIMILAFAWPGNAVTVGQIRLSLNLILAMAIVLAGVAGYFTMRNTNHEARDVWRGYQAGFVAVLIGYWLG